jgi:hypothetical protein
MNQKKDLEILLDLDGIVIEQLGGYWTKFAVYKLVSPTIERPHGIRYSLTLHNRYGHRILGFDNAHAVKIAKNNEYQKTYDHQHRYPEDSGVPYQFIDTQQLLKDFWFEVDIALKKLGIEEE